MRIKDNQYPPSYLISVNVADNRWQHREMMERFVYSPLPGKDWMRLMSFYQDDLHDWKDITCLLTDHPVRSEVAYSALSYTWGPPTAGADCYILEAEKSNERSCDICVNGKLLSVTPNLRDALIRLRSSNPKGLLWVDAICINQDDLVERGSQVNIMSEIYGQSTEVVVWLGEEDLQTRDTTNLIREIALTARAHAINGKLVNPRLFSRWAFEDPETLSWMGLPCVTKAQWKALMHLYSRRWFERLWVVQEVALSRNTKASWKLSAEAWSFEGHNAPASTAGTLRNVIHSEQREAIRVLCGSVELPWESLIECSRFLIQTGIANGLLDLTPVNSEYEYFMMVTLLRTLRNICHGKLFSGHNATHWVGNQDVAGWSRAFGLRRDEYDPNAYFCLFQFLLRCWRCTDPKDKVYALLGMLERIRVVKGSTEAPFMIIANYSGTAQDTYYEASRAVLENTLRLDLLLMIPDPPNRRFQDLPSWVQDYSVKSAIPLTLYGSEDEEISHFNTSKGFTAADLWFSGDGKVLNLQGFRVGLIADIGEAVDRWGADYSFEACAALALKCEETYMNGQSRLEALWRTIVTDQTTNTHPAPNWIGTRFFQWLRALFRHSIWGQIVERAENTPPDQKLEVTFQGSPSVDELAASDITNQMPARYGDLDACVGVMRGGGTFAEMIQAENAAWAKHIDAFHAWMEITMRMRLFRTENSLLGMGPRSVREGDEVWVLQGARVPFVLKPDRKTGCYQLIGQAYVHGIMQGEVSDGILGRLEWTNIQIA